MYRYYHRSRLRTHSPVGLLLEYKEGDPYGGTMFGDRQEALQPLVREGIIIEEFFEGVKEDEEPAIPDEIQEVVETPEEGPQEVLLSEEEAEGLKFGDLREYARKFDIVGRGRDEIVRELKEAGKVT